MPAQRGKIGGYSEPKTNLVPLVVHEGKLLAHAPWDLFHPCSWADPSTCQPDDGPQEGSSRTHAAICSPNKKTKAEPKGWSPDSTVPAKHPARDGLRSSTACTSASRPRQEVRPRRLRPPRAWVGARRPQSTGSTTTVVSPAASCPRPAEPVRTVMLAPHAARSRPNNNMSGDVILPPRRRD